MNLEYTAIRYTQFLCIRMRAFGTKYLTWNPPNCLPALLAASEALPVVFKALPVAFGALLIPSGFLPAPSEPFPAPFQALPAASEALQVGSNPCAVVAPSLFFEYPIWQKQIFSDIYFYIWLLSTFFTTL